jgi:hypothetical protein
MAIMPPAGIFNVGDRQSLQPQRNHSKDFSGKPRKATLIGMKRHRSSRH